MAKQTFGRFLATEKVLIHSHIFLLFPDVGMAMRAFLIHHQKGETF